MLAIALTLAAAPRAQVAHIVTVREVMEAVVAPATDVLWAAESPMSDDDWGRIDAAAIAIIAAGTLVKSGGAGSADAEWAEQAQWLAYTDAMIAAAVSARQAAARQDFDALMIAGEQIYAPCEACHLVFHPEVRRAE